MWKFEAHYIKLEIPEQLRILRSTRCIWTSQQFTIFSFWLLTCHNFACHKYNLSFHTLPSDFVEIWWLLGGLINKPDFHFGTPKYGTGTSQPRLCFQTCRSFVCLSSWASQQQIPYHSLATRPVHQRPRVQPCQNLECQKLNLACSSLKSYQERN